MQRKANLPFVKIIGGRQLNVYMIDFSKWLCNCKRQCSKSLYVKGRVGTLCSIHQMNRCVIMTAP